MKATPTGTPHASESATLVGAGKADTGNGGSSLAGDLLRGADAIAEFLFGKRSMRRRVYHLASHGRLPVFHIGATLHARKSTLLTWINRQEVEGRRSCQARGITPESHSAE